MSKYKVNIVIDTKKVLTKTIEANNNMKATTKAIEESKDKDWKIFSVLKTNTRKN